MATKFEPGFVTSRIGLSNIAFGTPGRAVAERQAPAPALGKNIGGHC